MILLDTHVVYWSQYVPEKISKRAGEAIAAAQAASSLAISAITLLEIARMVARQRVLLYEPTRQTVRDMVKGMSIYPISIEIASAAAEFPDSFPGDPGDRLIAATALVEGIALITADDRIRRLGVVTTIW